MSNTIKEIKYIQIVDTHDTVKGKYEELTIHPVSDDDTIAFFGQTEWIEDDYGDEYEENIDEDAIRYGDDGYSSYDWIRKDSESYNLITSNVETYKNGNIKNSILHKNIVEIRPIPTTKARKNVRGRTKRVVRG